jgi:peptidoglycan/LPS O-acetylase OafA/YrhL
MLKKPERLHDIDWLRVIGILGVFLFHCSHYFDFEDWHVKNPTPNLFIDVIASLLILWVLPLIFVISGISTKIILSFQTPGKFLRGRVLRLLIPLVFGIFFLTPQQVYIERLTHGQFSGSFFSFLPRYFDGFYGINGNFGWMGLHLWYLEMLFFYSLILLPLFLLLRRESLRKTSTRLFSKPGMLFVLCIPLVLLEIYMNPQRLGMRTFAGWGVVTYLLLFIYGYLVFSSAAIRMAAEKLRFAALAISLACIGIMAVMELTESITSHGTLNYALFFGVRALCMYSILIALFGLANRGLKINNRFLGTVSEAVLPFYVLHQPVIVAVGYYIMSWTLHPVPKWLFLILSSFTVIAAVYWFILRPINPLRFLFGMKLKERKPFSA